jgi:hypothetical protein
MLKILIMAVAAVALVDQVWRHKMKINKQQRVADLVPLVIY